MNRLRVAILTHSVNPRGGVVHALELGSALTRLGHEAVVHAPDPKGHGFFRPASCSTVAVPASVASNDVFAMATQRIADYVDHFGVAANRRFDVFHAQDSISANALATLRQRGLVGGFARTVHHLDTFDDARLSALQGRAVVSADAHFVVSQLWRETLAARYALDATMVGNGVDTERYSPVPDGRDTVLRDRLRLGAGPIILAIGGVEERKNTVRIVSAFCRLRAARPSAQLVIAGGASLLDHRPYRAQFEAAWRASGMPEDAVILTGPVTEHEMPALYRAADALAFPSVKEGFGLVAIEAMASGLPVILSQIRPFSDHIPVPAALWCDPLCIRSIADAMEAALDPPRRRHLIAEGLRVAARHRWTDTAQAHLETYARLMELAHA